MVILKRYLQISKTLICLSLILQGKLVSHNFIDIHTHLREPGFEHKETIHTGSLSALYGGIWYNCSYGEHKSMYG